MKNRARRIVHEERLHFENNEVLKAYYEEKYRDGGYEEGHYVVHGVDISAIYHARRRATVLRLLAPAISEIILDAGCGSGAFAVCLAAHSREVHAIDIAANAFAPGLKSTPNLRFSAMNLEALTFPDSMFHGIACVETLEHLLNPEQAITELHRVLKRDGRLVITYPTINRTIVKNCKLGIKVPISEHLTEWSYRELVDRLRSAGFLVSHVEGIGFDFGALVALKHVSRFLASTITRASLLIRAFPANSMFVAMRLQKR
jgi:2-polyprenyl-3-methyl-5-hydroxy-6-metoxy-1,4-benzoquinol methylase